MSQLRAVRFGSGPPSPPIKFKFGFPAKKAVNRCRLRVQPMRGLQAVSQFKVEIIDVVTTMDCTSMAIMLPLSLPPSLSLSIFLSFLLYSSLCFVILFIMLPHFSVYPNSSIGKCRDPFLVSVKYVFSFQCAFVRNLKVLFVSMKV